MSYLSMVKVRELLRFYGANSYKDDAVSRHRMVMSLFQKELGTSPRSESAILYRFEKDSSGSRCLIRSNIAPANLNGLKSIQEVFSKDIEHIAFRLTANPIRRSQGKEIPLKEQYDQEEWLLSKLAPALSAIELMDQKTEIVRRDRGNRSVIQLVQFDGIAKLEDQTMLETLMRVGVGRGKSYGAGLLTIKPLS